MSSPWKRLALESSSLGKARAGGEPLSSSSIEKLGVGAPSLMLGIEIAAVTRGSLSLSSTLRAGDAGLVVVVITGVLQVTTTPVLAVDVIVMSLKLEVR